MLIAEPEVSIETSETHISLSPIGEASLLDESMDVEVTGSATVSSSFLDELAIDAVISGVVVDGELPVTFTGSAVVEGEPTDEAFDVISADGVLLLSEPFIVSVDDIGHVEERVTGCTLEPVSVEDSASVGSVDEET